ncbi:unnamed protein product [Symbiodinium natans]|uniref:Uncharacterized protein n=1 Tax=Symbiodinium natans TaxID=878477 RepID=A0A812TUZ4_9DINO|nr:unnamed protein product [Symbiodinium natans]
MAEAVVKHLGAEFKASDLNPGRLVNAMGDSRNVVSLVFSPKKGLCGGQLLHSLEAAQDPVAERTPEGTSLRSTCSSDGGDGWEDELDLGVGCLSGVAANPWHLNRSALIEHLYGWSQPARFAEAKPVHLNRGTLVDKLYGW